MLRKVLAAGAVSALAVLSSSVGRAAGAPTPFTDETLNLADAGVISALGQDASISGVVIDSTRTSITVYHHGAIQPSAQTGAVKAAGAVRVRFAEAKYSAMYLQREIERLRSLPIKSGHNIWVMTPRPDGSGIDFMVENGYAKSLSLMAPETVANESAPKLLLGAKVDGSVRVGSQPTLARRLNDTSPFDGGARIVNVDLFQRPECTTGFRIHRRPPTTW